MVTGNQSLFPEDIGCLIFAYGRVIQFMRSSGLREAVAWQYTHGVQENVLRLDLYFYRGAEMDLKLDQKRRRDLKVLLNRESAHKAQILADMERDFSRIFGGSASGIFSGGDDDPGRNILGESISVTQDNV